LENIAVKEKMDRYINAKNQPDETKFIGKDEELNHEYDDVYKLISDISTEPRVVISKV